MKRWIGIILVLGGMSLFVLLIDSIISNNDTMAYVSIGGLVFIIAIAFFANPFNTGRL